jgi:hypothetical protein
VAVIFGVAIVKSKILSRWVGGAGVFMGAVTIYAGLEVAYLGFWRYNNYNWYLLDNLFYLDWNSEWFYVEKINVKEKSDNLREKMNLMMFTVYCDPKLRNILD